MAAAVTYAQWSAAAEYRPLAATGIRVNEISFEDLEAYLGRGRIPVLENVLLIDLLGQKSMRTSKSHGYSNRTMHMDAIASS